MISAILCIDVPDIGLGERFYCDGLGFNPVRRLFQDKLSELRGAGLTLHLLTKEEGPAKSPAGAVRSYRRHWTPIHLDLVVANLDEALAKAVKAGAIIEEKPVSHVWGRIAICTDPFGHGFCLIELSAQGYDAVAD